MHVLEIMKIPQYPALVSHLVVARSLLNHLDCDVQFLSVSFFKYIDKICSSEDPQSSG